MIGYIIPYADLAAYNPVIVASQPSGTGDICGTIFSVGTNRYIVNVSASIDLEKHMSRSPEVPHMLNNHLLPQLSDNSVYLHHLGDVVSDGKEDIQRGNGDVKKKSMKVER